MTTARTKVALAGLRYTLGLVILIEAVLFVMPAARHGFAQTHMPDALRLGLGWGEIIGCFFMLIPATAARGAWILVVVLGLALLTHLVHGLYNVGNLAIYLAAAWSIAIGTEKP